MYLVNEPTWITDWQVKIILYTLFFLIITTISATGNSDKIRVGGLDGLDPYDASPPYEVKLALSGGGARGLATIGVLEAFKKKEFPFRPLPEHQLAEL